MHEKERNGREILQCVSLNLFFFPLSLFLSLYWIEKRLKMFNQCKIYIIFVYVVAFLALALWEGLGFQRRDVFGRLSKASQILVCCWVKISNGTIINLSYSFLNYFFYIGPWFIRCLSHRSFCFIFCLYCHFFSRRSLNYQRSIISVLEL